MVEVAALAVFLVISLFFSRWALRPVARAWTQQRRFVADASHDLKTPLTVILANTSIALEHPERSVASQSQWLESTQHEAEAMQGLVGDLLTLAKMDEEEAAAQSGAARPALEEVDLSDVIEGEVLQFESVAFERGVKLESQVEPVSSCPVASSGCAAWRARSSTMPANTSTMGERSTWRFRARASR